jgi:RND family efflux transporter MFP subunit
VKQAQANINKAQTDLELGKTTLERYESLAKSGGVTQQQLDEKRNQYTQTQAAAEAAQANLAASTADVQRLEALVGFAKIVAPFAGTITSRGYDVGARLSSTDAGAGREIFQLAQTDMLRVFVNVPQAYVTLMKVGQNAELEVGNYPGRKFVGKITRSSGAIDPTTRTQRYEVDFPNKDGVLTAGMYAQVRFHLFQEQPPLIVPSSALVYDAQGMRIAIVKDGKAHFQNVAVGRDFGTEIEVQEGLQPGEMVVANPGERLSEGVEVDVADQPNQGAPPTQNKTAVTEANGGNGRARS